MSSLELRKVKQKIVDSATQPLYIGGTATDNSDAVITINSDKSFSLKSGSTTISDTELSYLDNVSSNIQTQINTKADTSSLAPLLSTSKLMHVIDQKASGTGGGSVTAAAWNTRTLNTVLVNNISGASLASNVITLPAGTYYVEASAPAVGDTSTATNQRHKVAIKKVDNTLLLLGTSECIQPSGSSIILQTRSFVRGTFTLAASTGIILDHYFTTSTSYVAGIPTNISGYNEVYSEIKIWKVS